MFSVVEIILLVIVCCLIGVICLLLRKISSLRQAQEKKPETNNSLSEIPEDKVTDIITSLTVIYGSANQMMSTELSDEDKSVYPQTILRHVDCILSFVRPQKTEYVEQISNFTNVEITDFDPNSEKPIVLLIEDNFEILNFIKTVIQHKYQVLTATDGKKALAIAQEIVPDLIISDLMMPNMDGYEFTCAVRKNDLLSHIPVVIMTALTDEKSKLEAYSKGASILLTKPVNPEELLLIIESALQRQENCRQQFQIKVTDAQKTEPQVPEKPSLDEIFIEKCKKVIFDNLMDDKLNVDKLSDLLRISRSALHRKLKAVMNDTPTHLIQTLRIEKAKELLRTTDVQIAEVAIMVGIPDPAYFSRCFRAIMNCTPLNYRRDWCKQKT